MVDGKCSKTFPKPFQDHTTMTEDSYAVIAGTMERPMRLVLEKIRRLLITPGLFHTAPGCSKDMSAISMWSVSFLSSPQSTSTNIYTKVIIVPLWDLERPRMKSNFMRIHVSLLALKEHGILNSFQFMKRNPMLSAFKCIFQENTY
jgi:hypothetical protein